MPERKSVKSLKLELKIQDHFIQRLKLLLPNGLGLAEELADVLQISTDSAYRRIRGETELTIEEIFKITKKYTISIDDVFSNQSNTVTFAYTKLTDSVQNFEEYLGRLLHHLKTINKFETRKIYYVAEETPLMYSFFSKKLTDFKLFYWQRSVLNIKEYQQVKFQYGIVPEKLIELAHGAYHEYLTIPSTEVWTDQTVFTAIRQIKYYFESGILSKEIAIELLGEYRQMIEVVHKAAETGRKNVSDKTESYSLYCSDLVLGTNCIYTFFGESTYSFISFNTLNSLATNNPEFCEETEHWVKNLERKSTLISGVGEKQRYQFFSQMFKNIGDCAEAISRFQ
jgi:plasmid maintenance system antidote protein VapI